SHLNLMSYPPRSFPRKREPRATRSDRFVSSRWVPACALGHAHISEAPSDDDSMELLKTIFEGDGPRPLGGWVPVPSAELCDDPGSPAKAFAWIWIFLERRLAFELGVEACEHGDFFWRECDGGGLRGWSVARLEQLQDDDSSLGGDGGELDQAIG